MGVGGMLDCIGNALRIKGIHLNMWSEFDLLFQYRLYLHLGSLSLYLFKSKPLSEIITPKEGIVTEECK